VCSSVWSASLRRNSYETTKQLVVLALGVLAHLHRVGLNRRPYLIKKKAAAAAVLPVCVCRSCSSEFVFAIYVVCDEPMPETACVCAPGVGCSDL
jgi:hypothetical protein